MGFFDNPKGQATFSFSALPKSVEQLRALPEAAMTTPFQTAALTVCALCVYAAAPDVGIELLNYLRGPRPLNGHDISFLKDRFRGSGNGGSPGGGSPGLHGAAGACFRTALQGGF